MNSIHKAALFLGFFFTLILPSICFSQYKGRNYAQQDVLYLKNHWILKGKITHKSVDSIKISIDGGSVFSFSNADVDHISKEKKEVGYYYKEKGFTDFTELGPLASKNTSNINVNTSAFSFQTVNGYKFDPYFFAGAGIGVDLYATQTFMPVFASVRGDLYTRAAAIPFYFLDYGYGFNVTAYANTNSVVDGKGGSLFAGGLGVKINFNKASGFLLSLGYRTQHLSETKVTGEVSKSRYERIALRAGFYF